MKKTHEKNLKRVAGFPVYSDTDNWLGKLVRHVDDLAIGVVVEVFPRHVFGNHERVAVLFGDGCIYRCSIHSLEYI